MSEQLSNRSWFRRNWKLVVNLVTLLALIILVYAIRHQVGSTLDNLKHLKIWALLLLIPIEVLNYHAQAKIYQRLFEIVGNRLSYRFLFGAALELNFVNHVFPSGGVTGLSYFSLRMRKGKELSSGKATLVHVMKLTLYVVAFEIILIFGMLALALMGRVNDFVVLVAGSLSTLLVVSTLVFIYIVGSKERIDNFFTSITKLLNILIKIVRPKYPETINIEMARGLFSDFHDNYQDIKNNFGKLKSPFWYSLLADMTEIAAIYTVYVAFGKLINVGAVVLAYGIANFAGLISVMPGGVGIYEALMTAVLASTGVPPGLSLPVTITYRIFNTLIQLPPGYYLYNRTIRRRSPSIEAKQIQ
jgi:uncharacterized protein (TIRG00374 family)